MTSSTVLKIAIVVGVAGVFAIGTVNGIKVPENRPSEASQTPPAVVMTLPAPTVTETTTATVTALPLPSTITATATATSPETVLLPVPGATITVPVPGLSGTPQPSSTATPSPSPTRTPRNHANGLNCVVLVEVDHGILIKVPCKETP